MAQRRQVDPLEFIAGIQGSTVVAGETFPADSTDTTFVSFSTGYSLLIIRGQNAGVRIVQYFAPVSQKQPEPTWTKVDTKYVPDIEQHPEDAVPWDAPIDPPVVRSEASVQWENAKTGNTISPEAMQRILKEIATRKAQDEMQDES